MLIRITKVKVYTQKKGEHKIEVLCVILNLDMH